ncbi:unnamed protein product [Rotaria sp. Silwood2]|nr:unnamed protein product [Rotaria sp. Silwood2]
MADLLRHISLQLIKIGVPIIVCISIMGNTLNIAVLCRYKMRKQACSLYFITLSIINLIYSPTILVVSLLSDGYQIKLNIRSLIACNLITYFGTLLSALSLYFIVFASINRWCASSSNTQRRNLSNVRTTKWLIFMIIIFFSLLFIISLVTTGLNTDNTTNCGIQGNEVFVQVYSIFQFILFSCLPSFLMLLFGCMTIYNIQPYRRMALTLSNNRRTENQLIRMLLVQVGVQLLLILPLSAVNLLLSFPNIYQPTANFYSCYFICRVIFHMSIATPFF